MVNDTNADQVTASDLAIREARNRVDGVKDVVPIYVRPNTEDSNTLQNNNTAISNYANNQIAKWVQKGGIDKEWDAYVKKVSEPTSASTPTSRFGRSGTTSTPSSQVIPRGPSHGFVSLP